jgi:hypothetical protein
MASTPDTSSTWAPRRAATPVAFTMLTVWVVVLFLPAFAGHFLAGPESDQIWTGIPFRWFGAESWRRTGHIPLWNPYLFGGLPFVGAMHGDIFYPTAWLRLLVPVDTALNLGFAAHLVLAGWFTFLFLRRLPVSWTGSLVGGTAYQLAGILTSLVRPGHDGKLYVSALLPLILLALVLAIRERRLEGYGLLALGTALGILSPHLQMMQYTLILAGLFALYLALLDERRPERPAQRVAALALALGAVALGFGGALIQLWPFYEYMPYAARSAGAQGWEYATSYAMPPVNIVDWLVPEFTGILEHYWGSNFFKLHSEYVGAATLTLAVVGLGGRERGRLRWFLVAAGVLFLLVSLGGHTPFYRLWYAIVPGVKVTRAPGMAFFIPTFVFATFAAFGVERLERGHGRHLLLAAIGAAALLLLLGASGGLGHVAERLADGSGRGSAFAAANADATAFGAVRSAVVVAVAAGIGLLMLRGRVAVPAAALALAVLVGADQWWNARRFFAWSPPAAQLYRDDAITRRLAATPLPWRVLDFPDQNGVYPTAFLMGKGIPNALGHHGNELHRYDELLGGKNRWTNVLGHTRLWNLLAVRFVLLPVNIPVPGYHIVLQGETSRGAAAVLYEADSVPPYARVIRAALKVPEEQIVPTLMDGRLDYSRLLLLPADAPVPTGRLDSLPPPSPSRATVTTWEPGRMTVRLDPVPAADAWLLVSENWYPDWRATVDGREASVLRGQGTFVSVPLPAGAREVRLHVASASYRRGALATLASLLGILAWVIVPPVARRRRG